MTLQYVFILQQPINYNYTQNQQYCPNYPEKTTVDKCYLNQNTPITNSTYYCAINTQNLDAYPQRPFSRSGTLEFPSKAQLTQHIRPADKTSIGGSTLKPLYNNATNYAANASSVSFVGNDDLNDSTSGFDIEDDLKVALTGDKAIDEEILSFYRSRTAVSQKLGTSAI